MEIFPKEFLLQQKQGKCVFFLLNKTNGYNYTSHVTSNPQVLTIISGIIFQYIL
jgi:hypothetical protein